MRRAKQKRRITNNGGVSGRSFNATDRAFLPCCNPLQQLQRKPPERRIILHHAYPRYYSTGSSPRLNYINGAALANRGSVCCKGARNSLRVKVLKVVVLPPENNVLENNRKNKQTSRPSPTNRIRFTFQTVYAENGFLNTNLARNGSCIAEREWHHANLSPASERLG